jgi:hypothetical protein
MRELDLIYLNKRGNESDDSEWTYYRTTPVAGLGISAGEDGSTVQVCRVTWPDLKDTAEIVDTPGAVGYTSAHPNVVALLSGWGIDHNKSVLIGVRER